ncbi:TlpA family protein disulfide reductase [Tsukamurella tyrosinosolvens]|uniref:TlpA family protein disulfide reductase n=1 Tax=Tsukamurella tyrosinosolvens TaxID=57704 RepID=UPI002DD42107|nr:TlpA disulfide reductase family protein [Tsukamurella tyrosinosolvens]MEC4613117.1 TlpA disulfide reductase family protein [Tsukamurella tyrosinosolvens]
MRLARRAAALLIAGAVAFGTSGCVQLSDQASKGGVIAPGGKVRQFYEPGQRSTVENLSGRSVTDPNTTLKLSDYAGKVVVVNVWGSWCAPCRIESPELERTFLATKDKGVQFLGINVRETAGDDAARDFIGSQGLTYPSIYDPPGKTLLAIGEEYPTTVVPMTFVLDRQHRVAASYLTTVGEKELTATIEKVLGEG